MIRESDAAARSDRRERALLWTIALLVFAAALGLRIAHIELAEKSPLGIGDELEPDAAYYDLVANRVAAGDLLGDEVFYMAPLYPYVLGGVYAAVRPENAGVEGRARARRAARLVQAVMGAVSAFFLTWIGFLVGGRLVGIVAGVLEATYGYFIFAEVLLMATALILLLHLAALLVLLVAQRRDRLGWWALSGALLGLCALAHGTALAVVVAVVFYLLVLERGGERRQRWARTLVLVAAFLPVVGVVTVRNWAVSGEWVLLTSNGGRNFFIGNNPTATGTFKFYDFGHQGSALMHYLLQNRRHEGDLSPADVSKLATRAVFRFVARNPGQEARLLLRKVSLMFNWLELGTRDNFHFARRYSPVLSLPLPRFGLVVPLGLAGFFIEAGRWLASRRRPDGPVGLLGVFFLAQAGAFILMFVLARYRVVAVACLMLFAGLFVRWLFEMARERKLVWMAAGLLLPAACALFVNRELEGFPPDRGWGIQYIMTGGNLLRAGDEAGAEKYLRLAMNANFDPLEGQHIWRAQAAVELAEMAGERGDRDEARGWYEKALEEIRREVPGRARAAALREVQGKLEEFERGGRAEAGIAQH